MPALPTPTAATTLHRCCPQCARPAALGRRFCGACRAILVRPCAACGFGNERDDVWCGGCGASVSPRAGAAASPPPVAAPSPGPARPPAVPPAPPARIHAPVPVRDGDLAALLAINARRAPAPPPAEDATDQDRLDELFGEAQ